MELASKPGRCRSCGRQTIAPPNTHVTQCPSCKTPFRLQPDDPLSLAHRALSHTASRFKDRINTASGNINMMVPMMNEYPGLGRSGLGFPPPVRPLPSLLPVSAHGRKRAVLCGVSYHDQKYKLNGSVNDVKCMRYFLTQRHGFPSDSIVMLTEEQSNPDLIPTKSNMRRALEWLVQGCQSGDSLVFHYSGHASQQLDYNGDEVDGYDEVLWPVDHRTEGKIVDDEINATIVNPLPRGAKLHAIMDACHSGTILDLPFVCRMNRDGHTWDDQGCLSTTHKGTNGGFAVSFGACDDAQIALDTTALAPDNHATGVLTYSFIQAVQNDPRLTYGSLLNAMRQTSRNAKTQSFLNKVCSPNLPQEPQLSSSEKFDIYARQLVL